MVVVVADARDLDRLDAALTAVLGAGRHVALLAGARAGRALPAVPGRQPGSGAGGGRHPGGDVRARSPSSAWWSIWDDGDDLHAEPRAPYPHAREVLLTRAQLAGCAALVGGYARTGEAQLLLETGWAKEIVADRDTLRARSPAIAPTGDDPQLARDPGAATARLPSLAWQAARRRAAGRHAGAGPGAAPGLPAVDRLRRLPDPGPLPALLRAARAAPARGTCRPAGGAAGRPPTYACPDCGGRRLRASVTGARRTAEELGRAFPGVPVRTSGRDEVLDTRAGRGRPWWWPRRAPSRSPRAATARCCCSTPGRC